MHPLGHLLGIREIFFGKLQMLKVGSVDSHINPTGGLKYVSE